MNKFLVLYILGLCCLSASAVNFIGHRGASYLAPENTVASAKLAWELGADAVEIDVYLTPDNKVVVIHDRDTERTAGVKYVVSETDSKKLRTLDVGSFKSQQYAGEKIPLLDEIINTVPEGKTLYIEIKCDSKVLSYIKQILDASPKGRNYYIIAFDFEVISNAKKLMPEVPCFWLRMTAKDKEDKEYIPHDISWINKAKEANLDGLDLHYAGLSKEYADAVHSNGMKIYTWTVDKPEDAKSLADMGIDGITTNRPQWLKQQLENKEQRDVEENK